MSKNKKRKHRLQRPCPQTIGISEAAIQKVALAHGVSVEEVRKQIKIAMLNPLLHGELEGISAEDGIPSPEELIAACAEKIKEREN